MDTLVSTQVGVAAVASQVELVGRIAGGCQHLVQVRVAPLGAERYETILPPQRYVAFRRVLETARRHLRGRVVWNVSSTQAGGGAAEILRSSIASARGAGIDARWVVIKGDEEFFRITKLLHNHLHGSPGDGGALAEAEHAMYVAALERNAAQLGRIVRTGDIVILHDPQTAGLVGAARGCGAVVVWRCHVGVGEPNELSRAARRFLNGDLANADAYVFSRRANVWDGLDQRRVAIIEPAIDAFSPKNQDLEPAAVDGILHAAGMTTQAPRGAHPVFMRVDGSPRRVDHRARITEELTLTPRTPYVLQLSRWDRLKDPVGVLAGFAEHVAPATDAHLVLAGPELGTVVDDAEAARVFEETVAVWHGLPTDVRSHIHLVCLPMDDSEEHAAIVNALQRRATVVVQKSLAEAFGLAAAEAMWKGRPLVASRVGGLQDQVEHGVTGMLVDDPLDLVAFGEAVRSLLDDPGRASSIGEAAQRHARDRWPGPRPLMRWAALLGRIVR
jgi:trehalose synthase